MYVAKSLKESYYDRLKPVSIVVATVVKKTLDIFYKWVGLFFELLQG